MFGVAAFFSNDQVICRDGASQSYERSSDSGRMITLHFCKNCGSTVFWEPEFLKGYTGVAVGCFASPDFPEPSVAAWCASRHDWVSFPGQCQLSDTQTFDRQARES